MVSWRGSARRYPVDSIDCQQQRARARLGSQPQAIRRRSMNGLARLSFVVVSLAVASAASLAQTAPDYTAILNAPDRTEADRKNDERRAPVKILAFAGVQPGWTILDMGAGAGYSTELM